MYTSKGSELYIEDILVDGDERSKGIGNILFDELKYLARKNHLDLLSWVVARDNDKAIKFYTEKQLAQPVNLKGFECLSIKNIFNVNHDNIIISKFSRDDEINNLDKNKINNILRAAENKHTNVLVAKNDEGKPLAISIANLNYSSFRTVYGYKIEMLDLADDKDLSVRAMMLLSKELEKISQQQNSQGHFNLFINPDSEAQLKLVNLLNGVEFKMSDKPNSYLDLYSIDHQRIHNLNKELTSLPNVTQVDSFAKPGKYIIG